MSTLEAIFIAILFLIPGFLIEKITNRIFQKTIIEDYSDFDKTVKYIILSIETMIINIIFISNIFYKNFNFNCKKYCCIVYKII